MCSVFREANVPILHTQRRNKRDPLFLDCRSASPKQIEEVIRKCPDITAIVNCVGLTRVDVSSFANVEDALRVNGIFPWTLAFAAEGRGIPIIHISTDGVFRGRKKPYVETSICDAQDIYGLSKRSGEAVRPLFLSIRCSIVGPHSAGNGLLEWFLRHPDGAEVPGFTNHIWNGVTTRQLAQFVLKLARREAFLPLRSCTPVLHFSPNTPLSKYELLVQINRAYGRKIKVMPVKAPIGVERVLVSQFAAYSGADSKKMLMARALRELVCNSRAEERTIQ